LGGTHPDGGDCGKYEGYPYHPIRTGFGVGFNGLKCCCTGDLVEQGDTDLFDDRRIILLYGVDGMTYHAITNHYHQDKPMLCG